MEKTLNSKNVFKGKFLQVIQDTVELPNGSLGVREYIRHPGAAMVIPLLDDGRVLMIRQFRYPLKTWFLEFPAGKIDQGEDVLLTAKRELEEETGYQAKDWRFLTRIHPVIGYADERIDVFLARNLEAGAPNLELGEHIETITLSVDELISKVRIGEISDVKTQVGVFWLEKILLENW